MEILTDATSVEIGRKVPQISKERTNTSHCYAFPGYMHRAVHPVTETLTLPCSFPGHKLKYLLFLSPFPFSLSFDSFVLKLVPCSLQETRRA